MKNVIPAALFVVCFAFAGHCVAQDVLDTTTINYRAERKAKDEHYLAELRKLHTLTSDLQLTPKQNEIAKCINGIMIMKHLEKYLQDDIDSMIKLNSLFQGSRLKEEHDELIAEQQANLDKLRDDIRKHTENLDILLGRTPPPSPFANP